MVNKPSDRWFIARTPAGYEKISRGIFESFVPGYSLDIVTILTSCFPFDRL